MSRRSNMLKIQEALLKVGKQPTDICNATDIEPEDYTNELSNEATLNSSELTSLKTKTTTWLDRYISELQTLKTEVEALTLPE